jgi:hypothetical protein
LPHWMSRSVAALKNVDLPTLAFPIKPRSIVILSGDLVKMLRHIFPSGVSVTAVFLRSC